MVRPARFARALFRVRIAVDFLLPTGAWLAWSELHRQLALIRHGFSC